MKTAFQFLLISVVLLSCNAPVDISGKLEGSDLKNRTLYLVKPNGLWELAAPYFGEVIDSAQVQPDGSFTFKNLPKSEKAELFEMVVQLPNNAPTYLQTDDPLTANYMPFVWQAGEAMQITAHIDAFQKSFNLTLPSKENKALLELRDIHINAYTKYLYEKQWQNADGNQLMEKELAVFQYQSQLINFADNTPFLLPALVALRWVSPENFYERVPEFLVNQCSKWQEEEPEHPWVVELCKRSNPANLPVLLGDVFPNLNLPLLSKDTVSIHNHLGSELTIIDVWASWCSPCRKENREVLVPLWDEYQNRGLQIIGYGLESDEKSWKAAIERDGANRWLQASDLQGDNAPILKSMRIQTIPANFIVDKAGVVIAKNVHGQALTELVKAHFENQL